MAFSITNSLGIDLNAVTTAASIGNLGMGVQQAPFKPGFQVWGDDGKRYVYAKASGAIPATTTACTVNASTFAASATGGSYTSPATAMVANDFGWFGIASV